jgi:hypothetical protein
MTFGKSRPQTVLEQLERYCTVPLLDVRTAFFTLLGLILVSPRYGRTPPLHEYVLHLVL